MYDKASVKVERGTGMDCGSKRDAILAVSGGLARIGAGLTRTVYVDARSRFVYKVENGARWQGTNRAEYEDMMGGEMERRGLTYYRTPCALYTMPDGTTVLCMPVRPKDSRDAAPGAVERFQRRLREQARVHGAIPDMHPGNYRVTPNGRVKITDIGFGADGRAW